MCQHLDLELFRKTFDIRITVKETRIWVSILKDIWIYLRKERILTALIKPVDPQNVIATHLIGKTDGDIRVWFGHDGWQFPGRCGEDVPVESTEIPGFNFPPGGQFRC